MSDVAEGAGWWRASDGKWYRPESSRKAAAHPRRNAPRRNRPGCLVITVGAALLLALIVVAVAAARTTSRGTRRVTARASGSVSTSTTAKATTTTKAVPRIIYRVKPGDSLTKIANQFRVSIAAILSRNQIANPDRLSEGQTLVIPPAPPLELIITPPEGRPGDAFQLELTGAAPSETIRFEIDSAPGKYTGEPHTATADGAVTARYQTDLAAPTGIYHVTATGNLGTIVRATFVLVATGTSGNP